MKHSVFIYLFLFIICGTHTVHTQEIVNKNSSIQDLKTEPVIVGSSFTFHSDILNEDRKVFISVPGEYNSTTKDYPVIYMPDGQWHFTHTTQAVGALAGNGIIPQMIIVAVQTRENRARDLAATPEPNGKLGGGADIFLRFMKEELVPFIEKNYRTYPYRLLSGSSFGGIFTLHGFFDDPDYFDAYLAYSPSTWWQDQYYVKRMEEYLQQNKDSKSYFYIDVANEGLGMGVNALAEVFEKNAPSTFKWKFEEYPDEIHETTAYKATFNGLKFVFSDWKNEKVNFAISGYMLEPGDSLSVSLNTTQPVHFTLDGSKPTPQSPLYTDPIIIKKPTVIKTLSVYGYGIPGNCDSLIVDYLPRFSAIKNLPELKNGLNYSYYEGNWNKLPDFRNITPVKTGTADNINMEIRNRDINFAILLSGYIEIPEDNVYNFFLGSDDGSKLVVDDELLIDNDGLHAVIELSKGVYLDKGKHKIEIMFFQQGGGYDLKLEYSTDKFTQQSIPENLFFN